MALSQPSNSFHLDRKSSRAFLLKSLISRRLLHLCPFFSDDVLAEYVTVLVCNGKNQNQATDDLMVFLGQRTEKFVSWLWKLLLKNEAQLSTLLSDSDSVNLMDDSYKSDAELPKDHHSTPPKERTNKPVQSSTPQSKVSKSDSSKMLASSDSKYETGSARDFEKHSRCTDFSSPRTHTAPLVLKKSAPLLKYAPASEENSPQCSKLSDKNLTGVLGSPPNSSSERRLDAGMHNSNVSKLSECPPMCYDANALRKNFSWRPVIQSSQSSQSRKSVWDRLGKPQHDVPSRSQITDVYVMERKQCKELSNQFSSLTKDQLSPCPLPRQVPPSINSGRKRQFDELSIHIDACMKTEKRTHNQHEKACESHKMSEVPSKSSQSIPPQVNDLKSRLCEIEKEMVNLRAKTNAITSSGRKELHELIFITMLSILHYLEPANRVQVSLATFLASRCLIVDSLGCSPYVH